MMRSTTIVQGSLALVLAGCGGTTEHSATARKPIEQIEAPSPPSARALSEETYDETCPFRGTWEGEIVGGPFAGETIRFVVDEGRNVRAVAGPSPVSQSWSLYENVLSVHNRSDVPYTGPCSPETSATYELDFAPGCRTVRMVSLEDPCEERRRTMDWLVLELQ